MFRNALVPLTLLTLFSLLSPAQAVPNTINYQGRLTDNSPAQTPVNATVGMRFEIWDSPLAGNPLWVEPASGTLSVPVLDGIFNVLLGSDVAIPPSVFTSGTSRYLQIIANGETLAPRQPISATAFAIQAQNAALAINAFNAADSAQLGGVAAGGYQLATNQNCGGGDFIRTIASNGMASCATPGSPNPLALSNNLAGPVINGNNNGPGFGVSGTSASGAGIYGSSSAGNAGYFQIYDPANSSAALWAATTGTGPAGNFGGDVTISGKATSSPTVTSDSSSTLATKGYVEAIGAAPQPRAVPAGNALFTHDLSVASGQYTSITTGVDGFGIISYYEAGGGDLKVFHCTSFDCSSGDSYLVDSANDSGKYTSVALGTDGLALISYHDSTAGDLKVAHCNNVACSSATVTGFSDPDFTGLYASIVIGQNGTGVISYYDQTTGHLMVSACSDIPCSSLSSTVTVDARATAGQFSSIIQGTNGEYWISYYYFANTKLYVARCLANAIPCGGSIVLFQPDFNVSVGQYTSITLGSDGFPLVAYYDATGGASGNKLKVAHYNGNNFIVSALAQGGSNYESIAVASDGLGIISYYNPGGLLGLAHCINLDCTAAALTSVDASGANGQYSSLTLGADKLPLISYWDSFHLKTAHCANSYCTPYFQRR